MQWILRTYFDMMHDMDCDGTINDYHEADYMRREAIARETVQPIDLRAPTRKIA